MDNNWYRFNTTEKTSTYHRKGVLVENPVQDKVYFSDEVLDSFSLETKHTVPFDQNFTAIPNYFFDYWGYILGMKAAYTWMRYVRHVYRPGFEQKRTLASMAKLMDISKNSLKEYISILEEYGFMAVFYKDNKKVNEKNNTEIRIMVRKTTPFLTQDLVNKLTPELQNYHAKDIAEFEKTSSVICDDLKSVDEVFGLNTTSSGDQNLTTLDKKNESLSDISTGDQNLTPIDNENDALSDISTRGQNLTSVNKSKFIHSGSDIDRGTGQYLTPKENTLSEYNLNIINSDFWGKLITKLKTEVSDRIIKEFFSTVKPYVESGCLILSSDNSFALLWIEQKYGDLITHLVGEIEQNIISIKYIANEN